MKEFWKETEKKTELNAENYIPPKEKPKLKMSRYTVMLIPDSTDGSKSIELTIDRIARYIVLSLAVVITITSLIVSFAVKNYKLKNDDSLKSQVERLNESLNEVNAKNDELSALLVSSDSQITELKSKVNELELELAMDYIPSVRPYKGSAVMLSNKIAEGALSFACLEGTYVISTARGTVESITDEQLGHVIVVDHQNGYKTKYITNGTVKVKKGDEVDKGDRIAEEETDDDTFGYIVLLNDKIQEAKDFIDNPVKQ